MRIATLAFVLIAASAVGATAAPTLAPTAAALNTAKSIRIHWTDIQPITGGRLVYRATRIQLNGERYTIATSMTNKSSHRVLISGISPAMEQPGTIQPPTFGVAYRDSPNPNITTRRLINVRATTFSPPLPQFLDPGRAWKGEFSGSSSKLRAHHTWWITYGLFYPGGYWISEHTFKT